MSERLTKRSSRSNSFNSESTTMKPSIQMTKATVANTTSPPLNKSGIFKKASVENFLRTVKSQAFEDEASTLANPTVGSTSLVGPGFMVNNNDITSSTKTRRSSSWAFWQKNNTSDTEKSPNLDAVDPSQTNINSPIADSSATLPGREPGTDKTEVDAKPNDVGPNTNYASTAIEDGDDEDEGKFQGNNNIKKVIIQGGEAEPSKAPRSQSWSIWNSMTENIVTELSSGISASLSAGLSYSRLQQLQNQEQTQSGLNDSDLKSNGKIIHQSNVILGGDAILSETTQLHNEGNKNMNSPDAGKPQINKKPNIVVPDLHENLPYYSSFSMFGNFIQKMNKRIKTGSNETTPFPRNLYRCEPRKFKRALIVGVHGFFPLKMIRPFIGAPTGTSMRFAQIAEQCVLQWASENNLDIEVQKIALEKEGKVLDRVEFFLDVMSKWKEDIENADFIFVAAHSQGTPVSILLLAQLIERNFIKEGKIVGLLGMAGINIGPVVGADQTFFMKAYSTIENQSLLELFEFQNFESPLSRKYVECLRILIKFGVKVTFIGSINDQLVPLYSAIASHVSHPSIYRGVYIDESSNTPDFVTRVTKLCCELQNLGYSDHGVIKQISNALGGPLTGGGHSRIYNDSKVYSTALNFTLATVPTSTFPDQPLKLNVFDVRKLGANPYTLPWCTRGLFYEVSKHLTDGDAELQKVLKEFDKWDPENKVLKDMKYRLNGIKDLL